MELIGLQVKLQLDCIFGLLGSSVNFINVKRAHFLYERLFSSYVLALNELSYEKFVRLTLMKLMAGRIKAARGTLMKLRPEG